MAMQTPHPQSSMPGAGAPGYGMDVGAGSSNAAKEKLGLFLSRSVSIYIVFQYYLVGLQLFQHYRIP